MPHAPCVSINIFWHYLSRLMSIQIALLWYYLTTDCLLWIPLNDLRSSRLCHTVFGSSRFGSQPLIICAVRNIPKFWWTLSWSIQTCGCLLNFNISVTIWTLRLLLYCRYPCTAPIRQVEGHLRRCWHPVDAVSWDLSTTCLRRDLSLDWWYFELWCELIWFNLTEMCADSICIFFNIAAPILSSMQLCIHNFYLCLDCSVLIQKFYVRSLSCMCIWGRVQAFVTHTVWFSWACLTWYHLSGRDNSLHSVCAVLLILNVCKYRYVKVTTCANKLYRPDATVLNKQNAAVGTNK